MSGNLIGGIVGGVIGFAIGGPTGAARGFMFGSAVGGIVMPGELPTIEGPRLTDLRVQASEYGRPIPIVYGTVALQGNVIWAADIKEVRSETEQGGKGGPSQTTVDYSYFGSFAVAICDGPVEGVLRIWAGPEKRLVYDGVTLEGGAVRIYKGDENQLPDPLIEQFEGAGNVPAYRGTCYVVFEDFPLAKDGNRLPFLTFEVSTADDGGTCGADYELIGTPPNQGRLYDVPPVKLGDFPSGCFLSSGVRPAAMDNDGNLYVVLSEQLAGGAYRWFVRKVSIHAPVTQSTLELGDAFNSLFSCNIAYDPTANVLGIIQEGRKNFAVIDCSTFEVEHSQLPFAKRDIIYSEAQGRFRMLDSSAEFVNGELSPDCYGLPFPRFSGQLVDCAHHGIAVIAQGWTYLDGKRIAEKSLPIYDPVRDRLLGVLGHTSGSTGYYDFQTEQVVTPADLGPAYRLHARYIPAIDKIIWNDADGFVVMDPAEFSPAAFPDECKLFGGRLLYADMSTVQFSGAVGVPVAVPNAQNKVIVVPTGGYNALNEPSDIFTFSLGVRGGGVPLSSVVADLSERAGLTRYDVSQLDADMVDGYAIAKQTDVRSAIDALRPAYYFDAVESQGIVRFVKRGGAVAATIPDGDLAAHVPGDEAGEPLSTVRKQEIELPREVSVAYMLAANDYEPAVKTSRRLTGASHDVASYEMPLVLTDTKAQQVVDVILHSEWAGRLSYQFATSRKYAYLEPTDLVVVRGHLMRIVKVSATPSGVMKFEAVSDDTHYYAPHVVVTETPPVIKEVAQPQATTLELM